MDKKNGKRTKLIFSIMCIIALIGFVVFILVKESNADEAAAKTFLTQYYTSADDSENIYKLLYAIDDNALKAQVKSEEEINNVLQQAYGTCVSHDTLRTLMADRILLASDELATRAGVSVTCMDVVLNEKTDSSNKEKDYNYSADVYIENAWGNCTHIILEGAVQLQKEDSAWKVTDFYPEENIRKIQLQLKRPEEAQSTESRERQINCKTYGFAL